MVPDTPKALHSTGIRLSSRDREILLYLSKYRTATAQELREKFWPNQANRNYYRRLSSLKEHGLIEQVPGAIDVTMVFRLTSSAAKMLQAQGLVPAFRVTRPSYSSSYPHDKTMNEIQRILESCPIISLFQSESEVRTILAARHGHYEKKDEGYKVPDAWFVLPSTKNEPLKAALELELSLKSKKRYKNILERMDEHSDRDIYFFVFSTPQDVASFRRIFQELISENPNLDAWKTCHYFYFTNLEELLKNRLSAIWENEQRQVSLESLALRALDTKAKNSA